MWRLLLTCAIVIVTIFQGIAQSRYYHNRVWGRIVLADTINAKFRWELLFSHRRQNSLDSKLDALSAPQFTSYWAWLHYSLSPGTRLSVSPFGYFKHWQLIAQQLDIDKGSSREFRWAARLDQEQKLTGFTLLNRYGLEYRFRDLSKSNVFLPNWRVRYMVRLDKPIRIAWLKQPFSLVVSNELFVQFGRAVRNNPNVFDQNRLYAGFNLGLSRNVRASLGYIYGVQERSSGREFDYSNILWTVITFDNVLSQFKKRSL